MEAAVATAIRAALTRVPGRKYIPTDELAAILDDVPPYNPVEAMRRCGYQPPARKG